VCCSVLQCVAVCCSVRPCVAVCCHELQRVAVCCSVLQCITECHSVSRSLPHERSFRSLPLLPSRCYIVLQCVAVCCSVLQCVAGWWLCVCSHTTESCHTGMSHVKRARMITYSFLLKERKNEIEIEIENDRRAPETTRHFTEPILSSNPQHAATRCNKLQYAAPQWNTHYSMWSSRNSNPLQRAATRCNTLQHAATQCKTLQLTALHCNTLQRTATRTESKWEPMLLEYASCQHHRFFFFGFVVLILSKYQTELQMLST